MALSKQIIKNAYGQDLIFNNAYIQITSLSGSKEEIEIKVATYDTSKKENQLNFNSYIFNPSVEENSDNFIKQGYKYLKTLDEFSDCVNVLEKGQY